MENCIFCKLANHEIPTNIVYENELVTAFEDANPVAPVHTLIVPKAHMDNILGLSDPDLMVALKDAIDQVAEIKGVKESGFRLINNCGADAGQTVMHLHIHLIGGVSLGEKLI
ncbi:MAG: HIT domain-containing protein [Clostridia bacterium]|nr:HIT domain-containing protein [Clostridia bacterium]